MLTAYVFGPQWDVLDASPFCTKLLAYLALAKIEHETRAGMQHIRNAPKGKMPYVRDGGDVIGDSALIAQHLQATRNIDTDAHLSVEQRAHAHALGRMLDENTYWTILYFRWVHKANFDAHTRPALFGALPAWQRTLLPGPLRKRVVASARAHGMGRHSEAEVGRIGVADFRSLAEILGDRPFLFGDVPCAIDASAFAFVTAVSGTPFDTPMREYVDSSGLVDYANRFAAHVGLA